MFEDRSLKIDLVAAALLAIHHIPGLPWTTMIREQRASDHQIHL